VKINYKVLNPTTKGNNQYCMEKCKNIQTYARIGSVACQACKYCAEHNYEENWIICKYGEKYE